jgi:Cft2 family RNA processing exonuclease
MRSIAVSHVHWYRQGSQPESCTHPNTHPILIDIQGRTVMLDCGIHPGRTGDDALPFFDSGPDASEIDLILISHFHLDHAASLPYFTEKVQVGGVGCGAD